MAYTNVYPKLSDGKFMMIQQLRVGFLSFILVFDNRSLLRSAEAHSCWFVRGWLPQNLLFYSVSLPKKRERRYEGWVFTGTRQGTEFR